MTEQRFSGSDIHCSLDGRSWTDPVTNSTMLTGVRLEQYVKSLLLAGETPTNIRPAFLHEATHHWCFLSAVGTTLASLQLRARKRAFQCAFRHTEEEEFALLEDVVRYMTATTIMRPLSEGLALFAEYDAVPSTTQVISSPVEWIHTFFGLNKAESMPEHINTIKDMMLKSMHMTLVETRLSADAVEAKAGLLGYPLSCENGGYLPGYLLVKSLWRRAFVKSKYLRDTDLFLCYLRAFFYEDLGFVAVLLDPNTRQLESANAIVSYFSQRFQQFLDSDLHADVQRFEKEVLEQDALLKTGEDVLARGLFRFCTDAQTGRLGYERVQALWQEMDPSRNEDDLSNLMKTMTGDLLRRRSFMHVGSLKVTVSVQHEQDDKWEGDEELSKLGEFRTISLSVRDRLLIKVPAPTNLVEMKIPLSLILTSSSHTPQGVIYLCVPHAIQVGEGEGSLNLFFSLLYSYRVCVVSLAEKPVAYLFFDVENDKDARNQFIALQEESNVAEEIFGSRLSEMLKTITSDSWMSVVIEHLQEQFPRILEELYLPLALSQVPDDKVEQCMNMMRQSGFYEILGKDGFMMRKLALLSIACSLSPLGELADWLSVYGVDLDETIKELQKCAEPYKIPAIFDIADQVVCFI